MGQNINTLAKERSNQSMPKYLVLQVKRYLRIGSIFSFKFSKLIVSKGKKTEIYVNWCNVSTEMVFNDKDRRCFK